MDETTRNKYLRIGCLGVLSIVVALLFWDAVNVSPAELSRGVEKELRKEEQKKEQTTARQKREANAAFENSKVWVKSYHPYPPNTKFVHTGTSVSGEQWFESNGHSATVYTISAYFEYEYSGGTMHKEYECKMARDNETSAALSSPCLLSVRISLNIGRSISNWGKTYPIRITFRNCGPFNW